MLHIDPNRVCSLFYISTNYLADWILHIDRGAVMAKADVKQAYTALYLYSTLRLVVHWKEHTVHKAFLVTTIFVVNNVPFMGSYALTLSCSPKPGFWLLGMPTFTLAWTYNNSWWPAKKIVLRIYASIKQQIWQNCEISRLLTICPQVKWKSEIF